MLCGMPTDKQVLNFVVEPELVSRLDEFRFKSRFPTRAAAIKWLLWQALDLNADNPDSPIPVETVQPLAEEDPTPMEGLRVCSCRGSGYANGQPGECCSCALGQEIRRTEERMAAQRAAAAGNDAD